MRHDTTVQRLELHGNRIGNAGAEAMAQMLGTNRTMTHLDLSNNEIGDEGAILLARGLRHNPTITALSLRNNDISRQGALGLLLDLKSSSLSFLDLAGNGLKEGDIWGWTPLELEQWMLPKRLLL